MPPCRNSKYCDWVVCALQHSSNFGAGNETRTRDPDLGKVVLYQLSYSRSVPSALSNFGAGNETRTRDPDLGKVVLYQLSYSRVLLNFAFVIFAFLRRYGRRIIREIFPSATPQKSFFCVFISSAEIISKTFNLASKSRRRKWIPALT